MNSIQIGVFTIEILLALGLTLLLERWALRYLEKHPLAPGGETRPVYLFGKISPILSSIQAGGKRLFRRKASPDQTPIIETEGEKADLPSLLGIRVDGLLMLVGIGVVIGSQALRWSKDNELLLSYVLLVAGAGIFLAGLHTGERGRLPRWLERAYQALAMPKSNLLFLAAGVFFTLLSTAAAGFEAQMKQPVIAVGGWLLGIGLTLWGGWKGRAGDKQRFPWSAVLWAFGLTLLALPMRVIDTAHNPFVLTGDEGLAGLSAMPFLDGRMNNVFTSAYFSYPSLFTFFQSIWIGLLGHTAEALRLPSAVAGALGVGVLYLFGRSIFNHRVGLFASLLLAGSHFHIVFSRIGLANVWDGLAFTAVLLAYWEGWKKEARWAFLLAGLGLGFSQFLYASGRALLELIPLWCLLLWLTNRKKFLRLFPDFLVSALVALIVVLPTAWYFAHHLDIYLAPMSRFTILGEWMENEVSVTHLSMPAILARQLRDGLRAYTDLPLRYWYAPGVPMLRTAQAAFFLIGIGLLAWRWKKESTWLLILWLVNFAVMGALTDSTPAAQRYVGAAPVAVLVAALGLSESAERIGRALAGRWRTALQVAAVCAALVLAVDDMRFYFWDYSARQSFGGENTLVAQRIADTLGSRPGNPEVLFFGTPRMGFDSLKNLPYLAPHLKGIDVQKPWGSPENPQPTLTSPIFIFLPNHEADLTAVQADYPNGMLTTQYNPKGEVLYWQYEMGVNGKP